MAKKQRKIKVNDGTVIGSLGAENLGLPEPFAAAPRRPGEYCLYIRKGVKLMTFICCTEYAAKKFLAILLEDDELAKTKGPTGEMDVIVASSGIMVRCKDIQKILNYELNENEQQWELPEPYPTQAMRFRAMSGEEYVAANDDSGEPTPKREKKEVKPRPSKEGLITIGQIAEEMKMIPREARAALRAAKVVKPEAGWAWSKSEVDEIKKILHNHS